MNIEYKPNSHRYREEQARKQQEQKQQATDKKVEKVVTNNVIVKKKNGVNKFFDDFVSNDVKNVGSYIIGDVLIPTIKKAIYDIIVGGLDMTFYGGSGKNRTRSTADRVSYRNYYDEPRRDYLDRDPYAKPQYAYDDVILKTRGEAEDVLDRMYELLSRYGLVTIADLYDLVGISAPSTYNAYGWTNLNNAEIVRVRDGYKIKLSRAVPID